jgi:hypothetical protein
MRNPSNKVVLVDYEGNQERIDNVHSWDIEPAGHIIIHHTRDDSHGLIQTVVRGYNKVEFLYHED